MASLIGNRGVGMTSKLIDIHLIIESYWKPSSYEIFQEQYQYGQALDTDSVKSFANQEWG